MENNEKKNHSLIDLMDASMSKIREMVDSNTIIGEPIQTPDGVTLIPVSRLSFGFGCGGGDYGKQTPAMFGGASTAGVKVEPVAFLVVKDGVTRVLPVGRACRDHGGPRGGDGPGGHGPGGALYRQEKRGKRELLTE